MATNGVAAPPHALLTPEALEFLRLLHTHFNARRIHLLERRRSRQTELDNGKLPCFLDETLPIRQASWTVAPIPHDLLDRRVEITGPTERKMVINALNSGAKVFMTDFEDSNSPTWENCIEGQVNLRDAIARTIEFTSPEGKQYKLNQKTAVLFVRPRGWHMEEKHVAIDGHPISASLFDFGIYILTNHAELKARGTAPYFYLPKMESHLEARLWNDVFLFAQEHLGMHRGTIRATVLIETILAAFEMDEILYELREHSAGLNCGRWDYIFSFIKKLRNYPEFVLPERNDVTMKQHFLASYVDLLIHTCHKRNIHAMGGMAAQIPIRNDVNANALAMERVRQDKLREVRAGHDGTWVAHPGLVPVAMAVFEEYMPGPNQIAPPKAPCAVTQKDLLTVPKGKLSFEGLARNIDVALQYMESWLGGNGCVPIYNLMEDAATAEISRAQLWQWIRYSARLDDGRAITFNLVEETLQKVLSATSERIGKEAYSSSHFAEAGNILLKLSQGDMKDFLTTEAYAHLA